MLSRRQFFSRGTKFGLAAATAPLWDSLTASHAFAQLASSYKAVVIVSMNGGNDGSNMIVPLDRDRYREYAQCRKTLALEDWRCLPLHAQGETASYGLHEYFKNTAALFNSGRASVIANIGPITRLATKAQLYANPSLYPASKLFSHPSSIAQWMSSTTGTDTPTGWGGRIADVIQARSGSLPPVLNAAAASLFTAGERVQGIVIQADGFATSLPPQLTSVISAAAANDANSSNRLVAESAKLRNRASQEQAVLTQAQQFASLRTAFPQTPFGNVMKTIANVIAGRSVVGANRQIFYAEQGQYDTHEDQFARQATNFYEFDQTIGPFMAALDEIGLSDQVLVCTHSDFGRSFAVNSTAGTDHGWGNHQLIFGGGITGGRIIGRIPDPVLGGADDNGLIGQWIPTLGVTQLTAAIGSWLGLNSSQVSTVFPDLANFSGMIQL